MTVGSGQEEVKSVKKHREKDEMTKIVLRRLPPGIGPDELRALFQPLPPDEPHAFWYCAATAAAGVAGDDQNASAVAYDADDDVAGTLRRARCAFARAYLAFREEKNALSFAERFNGYVFVDKNGIESMAIVELAPNQTVPKQSMEMAKQCDERVDTLTNDVTFLKFMKRCAQAQALEDGAGGESKRVTDFDELVRQLEEKRRRLEEGQVQETPLTEFIRQMALEKARKPRNRSALGAAELPTAKEHYAAAKVDKKSATRGASVRKTAAATDNDGKKTERRARRARRRAAIREEQQLAKNGGEKKKMTNDEEVKLPETKSAIRLKVRKTRRRGVGDSTATAADAAKEEDIAAAAGSAAEGKSAKKSAVGGGDGNGTITAKKLAPVPKGEVVTIKDGSTKRSSNKDRPERQIYRPGQRKTGTLTPTVGGKQQQQRKTTDNDADQTSKTPKK